MEATSNDRFVRLASRFALRGWLGQPFAIIDRTAASAHFIPKGVFDTLKLCNGGFRPSDAVFLGARRKSLELLAREGLLEFSDAPQELDPWQQYRSYPNRYLRQIEWSITGKCNYRCRHCYMSAPRGKLPQPSTEECLRIADELAECGVQLVKITGGEPLIRADFLQIVDRLLAGGVQISNILTNGALVSEELLRELRERGVQCAFDISFDGTDGCHDWLRGVEGAEEATLRAFALCCEYGFSTGAEMSLHRNNVASLRESIRVLGELGVASVLVGTVDYMGEACGMGNLLLSPDEAFEAYCAYLPQFLEDGSPVEFLNLDGVFHAGGGEVRVARGRKDWGDACVEQPACGTLRTTMYLGPDGYLLPCALMTGDSAGDERFPHVGSVKLAEALSGSYSRTLADATVGDVLERNPKCAACPYKSRCLGGCRARGVDDDGNADPMGVDPNACRYYLGGHYDRAKALVEQLTSGK